CGSMVGGSWSNPTVKAPPRVAAPPPEPASTMTRRAIPTPQDARGVIRISHPPDVRGRTHRQIGMIRRKLPGPWWAGRWLELEAPVSPGGPREASTEGLGRKTTGLGSTNRRSLDVKMGIVTKGEPDEPMDSTTIAERLLESDEPAIRYLTRALVLGESSTSRAARRDRLLIRSSPLVRALLSEVDGEGLIALDPYSTWRGSHWVVACLSDVGCRAREETLEGVADRN